MNNEVTNKNFADRQKDLFDCLLSAEKQMKNVSQDTTMEIDNSVIAVTTRRKSKRNETRHLRGMESIFKRPQAPISRCLARRCLPEFKKNPDKWTKYSLGDVKADQMSNQSNTDAALSFLQELEERKETDSTNDSETNATIKFRKSAMIPKTDEVAKPVFRSSKVIMPEYIVGQKVTRNKKVKAEGKTERKELRLDHLLEEDEEKD